MKTRPNDRKPMVAGTRVRQAFVVLALTLALLPMQDFFPVAKPNSGTLAQEEPAAASPGAERLPEPTPSPTQTPIDEATDTRDPSETPTETPTATATVVPSATASPVPAGLATSSPSVSWAAEEAQASKQRSVSSKDGGTDISPNHSSERAAPGATITYLHDVTNRGRTADYKNVTATSSQHWTVELLDADGVTPLTDHNSDGIPDTGRLTRGEKTRIVVRVTVPANAPAGTKDKTTVTAASALFSSRTSEDTATDTTTVNRVLALELSTTEVDFGQIAPDGGLDGAAPEVTSQVDDRGAYYVKEQAIQVVVTASVPWTGSCAAAENSGTATDVIIADGRLEWRLSGTTDWTPFPTTDSGATDACFPFPAIGTNTYVYDVRLRVERTDAPGTFRSTVTFTADP
jgi:hypothetical protein